MQGESLLPHIDSAEKEGELIQRIRDSVGKIITLHEDAEDMLQGMRWRDEPPGPLDKNQLELWQAAGEENTVTQRWSDGLVIFSCLGDAPVSTQINGIYSQFLLAGAMCLMGLARKAPLRGGIDIAWGVELRPGELYGPALANAYFLESECARFPRIIVGAEVERYLTTLVQEQGGHPLVDVARHFASNCLDMLSRDSQGNLYLDYLSDCFERCVTSEQIDLLWGHARAFIREQALTHAAEANEKLRSRYTELAQYFDSRPPPADREDY